MLSFDDNDYKNLKRWLAGLYSSVTAAENTAVAKWFILDSM